LLIFLRPQQVVMANECLNNREGPSSRPSFKQSASLNNKNRTSELVGMKNGNFRNGNWTAEAVEERRWLRSLVKGFASGV
jgi:hypothetical protein